MGQTGEVERLLATLRDQAPGVRCAGLAALVNRQLADEAWLRVAAYVAHALTEPSIPGWERERCLGAVPRIPVRSLRDLLARLAAEGDLVAADALARAGDPRGPQLVRDLLFPQFEAATEEQRVAVAHRLARVGDQRVLPFLLERMERGLPSDLQYLAMLDVSGVKARIRKRCRSLRKLSIQLAKADRAKTDHAPPILAGQLSQQRLWLAVALARSGDEGELERLLDECAQELVIEPVSFWGNPERAYALVAAGGQVVPRRLGRRLRPRADADEGS